MRVEPTTIDSFVHCLKRGGRGLPIVRDDRDRYRFIKSLYYLNDVFFDEDWYRATYNSQTVVDERLFNRLPDWPAQRPIVKVICYILMPNHIHLLLKQTTNNSVSTFMKKLGQSMSNYFNDKYQTKGSIFQGAYRGKTVRTDEYLRYVSVYIMVKNAFELFPGGLDAARKDFKRAWKFAISYPFSSLAEYTNDRITPIVDKDLLGELFESPRELEKFAYDVIEAGRWEKDKVYRGIVME